MDKKYILTQLIPNLQTFGSISIQKKKMTCPPIFGLVQTFVVEKFMKRSFP